MVVALVVNAAVEISVAVAAMLAGLVGIFAFARPAVEPHDPEQEYQKLVARLRAGVE